jgi:regulator of nucleoside diphosphate kinase
MLPLRSVLLGHRDRERLYAMLLNTNATESSLLYDEVDAATVVDDHLLPRDVVTMHSTITFVNTDTTEESTLVLVYPHEVETTPKGVSILAPVGAALIGLRVGESVEWPLPNRGRCRLTVIAVKQPA